MKARIARAMFAATAIVLLAGCSAVDRLVGTYTGPQPETLDIVEETVVLRDVSGGPGPPRFTADRVRYPEAGRPHDVNRVVFVVVPSEGEAAFQQLAPMVGDTMRISTLYLHTTTTAEQRGIPDWPGHDFYEYPVAVHRLASAAHLP